VVVARRVTDGGLADPACSIPWAARRVAKHARAVFVVARGLRHGAALGLLSPLTTALERCTSKHPLQLHPLRPIPTLMRIHQPVRQCSQVGLRGP
jgi:hypothetical protein